MNKQNSCAICVTVGIAIFLTACQTVNTAETAFEKKIELAIATSPQSTKERLELLRSNGLPEDKSKFLNQDVFAYPQKLEELFLQSKGGYNLVEKSGCRTICHIPPCKRLPPDNPSDCGVIICEPDPNCNYCKPGQSC